MKLEIYNGNIVEYDMLSAGISVATEKGLISEDLYYDLIEADKTERTILFGMALRDNMSADDNTIVKTVNDGIAEFVDIFLKENNIKEDKVLEIAKDAIFLKSCKIKKYMFGEHILFRCKGRYSYMIGFPASEKVSNRMIKLYKETERIKCRGAHINYEHPCYEMFYELFYYIINKDPVQWNRVYSKFKKRIKDTDNLISNIDNDYLVKVLLEASNEV